MRENLKNNANGANRLFRRLAAEKKKSMTALCLIAVMAFMWIRVLSKKTPEAAVGALMGPEVALENESDSELKISFIELPKVAGRNDVITRDFFASDGWRRFIRDGKGQNLTSIEEVNATSRDGSREVARRVAGKLELEAIVWSENPLAFINDKLLRVGDKLLIGDGANTYECEVVGIEENRVFIRCGEAEITLKLVQVIENSR